MQTVQSNPGLNRGISIVELSKELLRQKTAARDFIVPIEKIQVEKDGAGKDLVMSFPSPEGGAYIRTDFTNWAHGQLAAYADIPKKYYDRLKSEDVGLLAENLRHGFVRIPKQTKAGRPESRMVRTVDGKTRAFLSSSYRRLDFADIATVALPLILQNNLEIVSSAITDRHCFVKALAPDRIRELGNKEAIMYGLSISGSDVGDGSVQVNPFLFRPTCANGAIMTLAFKKFHLGRNQADDNIRELLSNETVKMNDEAFFSTVRDVITSSLSDKIFEAQIDLVRKAMGMPIQSQDPVEVVELAMKSVGISGDDKHSNILASLATGNEGAGYTQWGLVNSFTRAANLESDYEESETLQKAGGRILELSDSEWRRIAGAGKAA